MTEASVLSDPSPAVGGHWRSMDEAPRDRKILVRRHNDVFYEHYVVWWSDNDPTYPWAGEWTAYPHDRLDEWMDIPT